MLKERHGGVGKRRRTVNNTAEGGSTVLGKGNNSSKIHAEEEDQ